MDGAFACPECGETIRLRGLSPGREVRCGWCSTWVEVPYLPRADQIRRGRKARGTRRGRGALTRAWRAAPFWARAAAVVLCLAIGMAATRRAVTRRWQSAEAQALARLVDQAGRSERSGRPGDALAELEAALALAGRMSPAPDLPDLRERRDALALREAEARLDSLESPGGPAGRDPGRAVGEALTLLARVNSDPALGGLQPAILAALERLRTRWAEADGSAAVKALEAGRFDQAMDLCARQYRTADELPPGPRHRLQGQAAALATRIIERHGAIVEPVTGHFTFGTPESYARQLRPMFQASLLKRGYLPRPLKPVWDDLWEAHAPFRVALEVNERHGDPYLESKNRVSQMEGVLTLTRHGTQVWRDWALGRTEAPLPGLPAYIASQYAVSEHRSPAIEHLLYENARTNFVDRIGISLRNIPERPADAG